MKEREYLVRDGNFYYFRKWLNFPLLAFFTSRKIDFSQKRNLKLLCKKLNIKNLILPIQKHSSKVGIVNFKNKGKKFFSDALITKELNLAIGVLTADCFSIFLYDPLHRAIGIVHAGWRGTREEIVKNTIIKMKEEFSTNPSDLQIAFGPGIRECCYEIKEDLREYFSGYIQEREGKLYLDLKRANLEQLYSLGVKKENILDSGICTVCQNSYFFSYRKEGEKTGRIISLIMLKNNYED